MVIEPRDRHIDGLTNDATPGASDHQQIVDRSRSRAPLFSSFCSLASSPPVPLALGQPAIICYVRDSKLTAILASCHSYVLPFVSPVGPERLLILVAPGHIKRELRILFPTEECSIIWIIKEIRSSGSPFFDRYLTSYLKSHVSRFFSEHRKLASNKSMNRRRNTNFLSITEKFFARYYLIYNFCHNNSLNHAIYLAEVKGR